MGWRKTIRTLSALERSAQQSRRAVQRQNARINRSIEAVESEVSRERSKLQRIEQAILEKPISALKVAFSPETGAWECCHFGDDRGQVKWGISLDLQPEPATFVPRSVTVGPRTFTPASIVLAKWATYVAFTISEPDVPSKAKKSKLIYKSQPSRNAVLVRYGAQSHRAREGTLDNPVPTYGASYGLVAFPPAKADSNLSNVSIDFLLGNSPISIRVVLNRPEALLAEVRSSPTLLERFDEKSTPAMAQVRSQVRRSGCSVIGLALLLFLAFTVVW